MMGIGQLFECGHPSCAQVFSLNWRVLFQFLGQIKRRFHAKERVKGAKDGMNKE